MAGKTIDRSCLTCRQRRKGCDKTKPVCRRCVTAGVYCGGYPPTDIFIHAKKLHEHPASVELPLDLARSAREQLYFGLLKTSMLANGRKYTETSKGLASVDWTDLVGELYQSEPVLRYAAIAWATSLLAERDQDNQLRIKGLLAYNDSVAEMGRALQKPSWYRSNGLLVAARLMSGYELLFPSSSQGPHLASWRSHGTGQLAMLVARGPEAFTSGASHQLFVDARLNMATIALAQRRRSPLSTKAWKTIPWKDTPKTMRDRLVDIMFEMPAILEQVAALRKLQHTSSTSHLEYRIVRHCEEVETQLREFSDAMGDQINKFDYTIAGPNLPDPQDGTDFSLVHMNTIFWFNQMILYSVLSYMRGRSGADDEPTYGAKSPALYAAKCLHAAPLFFCDSAGTMEASTGLIVVSVAMRYCAVTQAVPGNSAEMRAFRGVLDKPLLNSSVGGFLERLGGTSQLNGDNEKTLSVERHIEWVW